MDILEIPEWGRVKSTNVMHSLPTGEGSPVSPYNIAGLVRPPIARLTDIACSQRYFSVNSSVLLLHLAASLRQVLIAFLALFSASKANLLGKPLSKEAH